MGNVNLPDIQVLYAYVCTYICVQYIHNLSGAERKAERVFRSAPIV